MSRNNVLEPGIAAVVLAAGRSRRMGAVSKLLTPLCGRPLVDYAVAAARDSMARPVIVVVGHQAASVARLLRAQPVTLVENPTYEQGLATSLRAGVAALPAGVAGAVVLLGDAPLVRAAHIDRLIAAYVADARRPICVPMFAGRRGNPVLWPARYFSELRDLAGDTGARPLLARHAGQVLRVAMDDAGVLFDVDTPHDLRVAAGRLAGESAGDPDDSAGHSA